MVKASNAFGGVGNNIVSADVATTGMWSLDKALQVVSDAAYDAVNALREAPEHQVSVNVVQMDNIGALRLWIEEIQKNSTKRAEIMSQLQQGRLEIRVDEINLSDSPELVHALLLLQEEMSVFPSEWLRFYKCQLPLQALQGMRMDGVDLYGMDLSRMNLAGTSFVGAILTEVDLSDADLTWANFTNAEFDINSMAGATLTRAIFTGTKNMWLSKESLRNAWAIV